ncbi:MAG: NAD(P)-binding domain-containing protein [Micrococcaceae bacterium]
MDIAKQAIAVTIIGAGKFGSTLAEIISRNGTPTTLVTRSSSRLSKLEERLSNRPKNLQLGALDNVTLGSHVFLALASTDCPDIIEILQQRQDSDKPRTYISLSKGLTDSNGATPLEILVQKFGPDSCAVVSGPSLANEMIHHRTRLVAAAENLKVSKTVTNILRSDSISCGSSIDPHGVEFAAIAKNIATLAFHACNKATGSLNTAGSYASSIYYEMFKYAKMFNIHTQSFMDVAGIGDLLTTSHAPGSRNKRAGELLGDEKDLSVAEIETTIKQTIESLHSIPLLQQRISSNHEKITTPAIELLNKRVTQEIPYEEWLKAVSIFDYTKIMDN